MTSTQNACFYQFGGQITAQDVPTILNGSLHGCFYGATASQFGNIGQWDVSGVTDMTAMFENATLFNGSIGSWNTKSATSMRNILRGCSAFTQDISLWDYSNVLPQVTQGTLYNMIYGTNLNPLTTTKVLLKLI